MPACAKYSYVGSQYNSQSALWLWSSATAGASIPYVQVRSLVPDTVTTDLSKCDVISLSGSEYQSLTSRLAVVESRPAPSTGGSTVNVTADIFVGAALVCIFVLGWIAGAQR